MWEVKGSRTRISNSSSTVVGIWVVVEWVASSRTVVETVISNSSNLSDKWVKTTITILRDKAKVSRQINSNSNRTTPVWVAASSRWHQTKPTLRLITSSNSSKWIVIFRTVGWAKCLSSLATSAEALSFLWAGGIRSRLGRTITVIWSMLGAIISRITARSEWDQMSWTVISTR